MCVHRLGGGDMTDKIRYDARSANSQIAIDEISPPFHVLDGIGFHACNVENIYQV